MYLSPPPQFIIPANGSILRQALVFGTMQIVISVFVNAMIAISAATVAVLLTQRSTFARWSSVGLWAPSWPLGGQNGYRSASIGQTILTR